MEKFTLHRGIAVPLIRLNIDTDAIIPSREMKAVSKTGLAGGLFAGWRYLDETSRTPNPDFALNRIEYKAATILLSGKNFGCGSSREHAVWALKEYGFRAIIASSFGAIFYGNCIRNGLLPITLDDAIIKKIAAAMHANSATPQLTLDLQNQTVMAPDGEIFSFEIAGPHREMLLKGLDPIALTLKLEADITGFQRRDRALRPWAYLAKR